MECGECEDGMQNFKTDLISICGKEEITHVKYKQWMFTDNDQKQDITAEVTEYTEDLGNSLADYRTHKFLEKKQIPFVMGITLWLIKMRCSKPISGTSK